MTINSDDLIASDGHEQDLSAERVGRIKAIIAGAAGNFVEWFDWSIYGYFAIYFSTQFFAPGQRIASLLSTLLVFAIGFFFRPLGGAILGSFADRRGRKAGMALTIALMAGSSLVIGILPTWSQVGFLAPLLLVIVRAIQGFSAGGEFGTSSAFMVEKAEHGRRAFVGSWQQVSVALGALGASAFAAVMFALFDGQQLEIWGWRVPFIAGGLLGFVGLWLRMSIHDTAAFIGLKKEGKVSRAPLTEVVRRYPIDCLRVIRIVAAGSVTYYLWLTFIPTFARIRAGAELADGQLATTVTLIIFIILLPFSGLLSDKVGRKPVLMIFAFGSAIAIPILMGNVGSTFWGVLVPSVIGAVLLALYSGTLAAVMAEQFPPEVRTVGISLPYGIAVAIFGGLTPYFVTWTLDHNRFPLFIAYAILVCVVSGITYWSLPETKDKEL